MDRRDFLRNVACGATLAALAPWAGAQEAPAAGETREGDMIYRTLGRTGEKVSLLGLGGHHIGTVKDDAESIRLMRTAVDGGVNFFDNSWGYNNGRSETLMGRALKDGYREKVFLMTKVDGRTKEAAAKQLEESLQRLDVDHIDLWQFHEIIRLEDPDRIFGEGGAMEVAREAQKQGKIRYIGFTGHKDPAIHLRMLEAADRNGVKFDAVQMPLNVMDAHFRSFEKDVLPELVRREIGVLGMKSLGSGAILKVSGVTPEDCLHYAMSLPTSVVISGMDSVEILQQNLQAVRRFKPMEPARVASLLAKTAEPAATGDYEKFKTTTSFDATTHHPEWMG